MEKLQFWFLSLCPLFQTLVGVLVQNSVGARSKILLKREKSFETTPHPIWIKISEDIVSYAMNKTKIYFIWMIDVFLSVSWPVAMIETPKSFQIESANENLICKTSFGIRTIKIMASCIRESINTIPQFIIDWF